MNSKKKADLQRKLTLAPVPKPPADLADRIKRDIPQHFTMSVESERDRMSRTLGLNMRVAASVLLVVSSAYLFMQLFATRTKFESAASVPANAARVAAPAKEVADTAHQKVAPAPLRALGYLSSPPAAAQPAPELPRQVADGRLATREERQRGASLVARADRDAEEDRRAGNKDGQVTGVIGGVVGGVAGGVVGGAASSEPAANVAANEVAPPPPPVATTDSLRSESITVTSAAPIVDAPQPAAMAKTMAVPAAPAAAPASGARESSFGYDLVRPAQAADLDLGPRDEVLGISVDPNAFERVKSAIEHGEQPKAVNVEALVNYFAGRPPHTKKEIALETEGSPAPVGAAERKAILRYTIDTATVALPEGASVPPAAADAKVQIAFESAAVSSHRRIGGEQSDTPQETLLKNESVTALYEIEMKPDVTPRQRVATVSLSYRSVQDGQQRVITRTITGRDFARPWRTSSRRHRLASLGAVWGETLKTSAPAMDVALRAEELAIQEPKDAKARELADVASASSRLRTSSPTGSGR